MVKFKKIKPFLFEMLSLVCVIGMFCICFFNEHINKKFIEIKIHVNFLSVAFIVLIIINFIAIYSRIMCVGIRSVLDFTFQRTREDNYIFVNELPYQASYLTVKWQKNHSSGPIGVYYLIQVKKTGKIYTFYSAEYLELEKSKRYTIKTAALSNIVLDYQICAK